MAFATYLSPLHVETPSTLSLITSSYSKSPQLPLSSSSSSSSSLFSSSSINRESRMLPIFPSTVRIGPTVKVKPQASGVNSGAEAFTEFKHLLLPIIDRNPYLSEGTRQAAATTTALAKKYGADITVVVIDEKLKESLPEHDSQLSSIRWHLSEGIQAFRATGRRKQTDSNNWGNCRRDEFGFGYHEHGSRPLETCRCKSVSRVYSLPCYSSAIVILVSYSVT